MKFNGHNKKAFTLIELLVVVAIIGILAAVGVVAYNGYTTAAKEKALRTIHKNLVNLMNSEDVVGIGSYNYRGNWNWLDQIIISKNLINSDIQVIRSGAFQKEYMMYTNKKGEKYPSRTYGGSNWYGGFSDHLPIFLSIAF